MKPTILVVDDNHYLREALSDYFKERSFSVLEAANGLEALEVLGKNNVHVILSDIQMPKMDGVDFLKAVCRMIELRPRVYLMSGWSRFSVDELTKIGAAGFFSKPIDLDQLSEFSSRLVNHEKAS